MTVTDRTAATEQEFRDRIAAFEAAPTPPEVREAAVLEEVARAIFDASNPIVSDFPDYWHRVADGEETRARYRRLAAAAVAAYRAQDGGAEEAVRRVEALADREDELGSHLVTTDEIRAALAPQAGDGAR